MKKFKDSLEKSKFTITVGAPFKTDSSEDFELSYRGSFELQDLRLFKM